MPLIGPSRTMGAIIPVARRPAMKVVVFQWAWGDGGTQAAASGCTTVYPGHLGRGPGLIDEHQAFGLEIELPLEPVPTPLQDIRSVLLGSMRRLFLRVTPCRSRNRHSVAMPAA